MTKLYKFNEVLNDLMDYFILGDPDYLLQYKIEKGLPDDLLTEFTTKESGDEAVENGVMVPMIGIENYPYTIYFNLSGEHPELLKAENKLLHRCDGYCMKVENERIFLYTMPYLKDFTTTKLESLKKNRSATIAIQNGWYDVSILGGLTKQISTVINVDNTSIEVETMEPTFEFIIVPTIEKPIYSADFMYRFKVESE